MSHSECNLDHLSDVRRQRFGGDTAGAGWAAHLSPAIGHHGGGTHSCPPISAGAAGAQSTCVPPWAWVAAALARSDETSQASSLYQGQQAGCSVHRGASG